MSLGGPMPAQKLDGRFSQTSDVISISMAWLVLLALCLKAGWNFYYPNQHEGVEKQAQVYAYQLWEINLKNQEAEQNKFTKSNKIRGLATESTSLSAVSGTIGNDLWLHPYKYQFRENENGRRDLLVWSAGADGLDDSSASLPNFRGDDLGIVLKITNM